MARTLIRLETQTNNNWSGGTNYFLRADGSTALEGDLDANSNSITNLASPTNPGDAASKSYVDGVAQGLDVKDSVRVLSESNIDLASATDPSPVDGVTLADGDRILLNGQTDGTENGIYDAVTAADPTTWTRSADFDGDSEVTAGAFTFVEEGTSNSDTGWVLTTDDPITVGTTSMSFSQFSGAGAIIAGTGLTKSGSTINFNATDASLTVNTDDAQVAYDSTASTIELGDDGIRVATATAGQILIGQGGTETVFQTIGGDATLAADGTLTLDSTVIFEGDYVARETPTGVIDNSNTTFTLANTPVTGTDQVFFNGQLLVEGGSDDYTISGNTITLNFAPKASPGNPDILRVSYIIDQ